MAFNFGATESAKANSYLKPGRYRFKVKEVSLEVSKEKKTKYLKFTFENSDGQTLGENFMLSDKALGRLQYFHEAWAGKKSNKNFKTEEEVQDYFSKTFVNPKAGSRVIQVNGKAVDGTVYAELPYADFILDDDAEVGEFAEDSKEYKSSVRKATANRNESSGKKGGVLNDDDDDDEKPSSTSKSDNDAEEDAPW